jgi:putative ATPase
VELPQLLALRGEADLRFDALVGRSALGALGDKVGVLKSLAVWLRSGGRLSLVEAVVRHAQRLYQLVDLSSLAGDLGRRLIDAEEQIYDDLDDPLVNWDAADLRHALEAAGFEGVSVALEEDTAEVLVGLTTLSRWFETESNRGRPSYAQHLLRQITAAELAEVRALFQRQLSGQIVLWRSHLAFPTGHL